MAQFIGNALILITYIRVLFGVTIISQSIFIGFGTVIAVLFLVMFWESKSPTQGKKRLLRGVLVFLATLAVDLITYILA